MKARMKQWIRQRFLGGVRLCRLPLLLLNAFSIFVFAPCCAEKKETASVTKTSPNTAAMPSPGMTAGNRGAASQPPAPEIFASMLSHDDWLQRRASTQFDIDIGRSDPQTGTTWRADTDFDSTSGKTYLVVESWPGSAQPLPKVRSTYVLDISSAVGTVLQVLRTADLYTLQLPCDGCEFREDTPTEFQSDECLIGLDAQPDKPQILSLTIQFEESENHYKAKTFCLRPDNPQAPDQAAFLSIWNGLRAALPDWEHDYYKRIMIDYESDRELYEDKRDNLCIIEQPLANPDPDGPDTERVSCMIGQPFP